MGKGDEVISKMKFGSFVAVLRIAVYMYYGYKAVTSWLVMLMNAIILYKCYS